MTGSGNVEVLGDITWQSGGISSTVVINVASNATLNINGPLGKTFEGSAVINLYGTGTWSAGTINVSSSTQRLNIFGTLNTSGSVSSSWNSPSSAEFVIKPGGVVNNTGSVSLTANSFRFINEGTLNVLSGTFAVNTLSTLSGEINVSEFATFSYNSNTMTLNSGALFSGAGLKLLNGGTMTIAANCTLSGGTLQNVAATMNGTSTLSVNSGATFNWQGGTISGSAKVDVLSGGTLTINTVNAKNMGGTAEINHYGTGTWSAGTINASTGTHRINIYGTLDINGAVSTSWNSVSTAEFVIKSGGLVNKSNGTTSLDANSFRFINEGTLNVLSGTFAVNTLATISGEINASSGGTFSYNANTATLNAGTLFSGAGLKVLNSGTMTIASNCSVSGGTFRQVGGTLNGTETLSVNNAATFNWQGGTISGSAKVDVLSGGTLTIDDVSTKNLAGSAVLNHYGIGTWSAGTINVSSSTQRLNIFGTLNTSGSVSSSWNSPSSAEFVIKPGGVVNNTGSVSLTANSFRFINEGTLNVLSGTFAVNTLSTLSGEINVSEFATFSYNSNTMTLNSGALFSGAGLKLLNGGTMTIAANCTLSGGTLQNVAATMNGTSTLSVNSGATFNWQGGTISGSAKVDVLSGGTLTINTVNAKNMGGTAEINHYGTGTWSAGTINASTGTHRINIYGTLDINGAVSTSWNSVSTAEFVIKSGGLVNKSNGTTSLDANSFRFINEGTLNVLSGTFAVNTLATISGEINASSGGTFSYNANTATLNAGTLFSGAGLKVLNSGTMTIASNCSVNGGTFSQTGGTLNGTATLTVNSGATFNWQGGTISGSAKVDVLSGGTLTINDVFTKNMGGTAEINHYGTGTWSAGSINASSGTQRINIYGNLGVSGFLSTSFNSPSTSQFIVKPSGILQLNTATVTYGSNAFTVTNEGTIRGSGTILFNTVFSNSGNLEPGLNIGILTINGSMPIGGNSNLVIQLQDGSGPGSGHDQLTRNTNLVLAGSLTVLETGPVPNGTYTIIQLTAGIISGAFATVNLPPYYTLQVNSNNVQVIRNVPPCFDEFSSFNITACGGYVWNNVLYTASGSYDQVFVTNLGCDSTVTLNLTLVPCPTTQLQANFCNISGVTMDMPLRAINVNAPEYRFKVVGPNNGGPGWNGNTFIYDSPTRFFVG